MTDTMPPPSDNGEALQVWVTEHIGDLYGECKRNGCNWQPPADNPEREARAHALANPGHTAIIREDMWTEYVSAASA